MMKKLLAAPLVSFITMMPFNAFAIDPSSAEFRGLSAYELSQGRQEPTNCSITWSEPQSGKNYCFKSEEELSRWQRNAKENIDAAARNFERFKERARLGEHSGSLTGGRKVNRPGEPTSDSDSAPGMGDLDNMSSTKEWEDGK